MSTIIPLVIVQNFGADFWFNTYRVLVVSVRINNSGFVFGKDAFDIIWTKTSHMFN